MTDVEQPHLLRLPLDKAVASNAQQHGERLPSSEEENAERDARMVWQLKALADPLRWKLVQVLAQKQGTLCVQELAATLFPSFSKHTICGHLRHLYRAGLLDMREVGLYSYYSVKPEVLELLQQQFATIVQDAQRTSESTLS